MANIPAVTDIEVSVRGKVARVTNEAEYICGNSDFVVKFSFDPEWDEFETKTARFIHNGKHTDVVFTGDTVSVPVIYDTNIVFVGVFAGNLHTSTPARIHAKRSILCSNGAPADPPDEVYHQIMKRLDKAGGLPSGGAPHQQLVTDGDGNAKWEDKLAYSEVNIGTILQETTVSFDSDDGEVVVSGSVDIEVGKDYTVIFDGVEYNCVCFEFSSYPLIGSSSGNFNDYPFIISNDKPHNCIVFSAEKAGDHTFSVIGEIETVHSIPQKFISGVPSVYHLESPFSVSDAERAYTALYSGEASFISINGIIFRGLDGIEKGGQLIFVILDMNGQEYAYILPNESGLYDVRSMDNIIFVGPSAIKMTNQNKSAVYNLVINSSGYLDVIKVCDLPTNK